MCTTSRLPPERGGAGGHVPPPRHNSCPRQSAPSWELGCCLSNREILALSAASLGHSRLQQTLSECSRREWEPSLRWQAWMLWRAATPWMHPLRARHLGRQRRSPAWELGNCKNCIMCVFNLPLWVQSWSNTGCSLPQNSISLAQSWLWSQSCGNQRRSR